MSMLCNNDRVCWVIFHFIKLLHSKHLSSFLQNFSMRCFRCGKKKNTVQKPITRSLNNNFILESTPSRIFLFSFQYLFFTIMFSSSKFQYSRLYFPFIFVGTKMCLNFKFCEKRGNTDLRAGAKLTT